MNREELRWTLGATIWEASRADEGTISYTGANHVADALIAGPIAGLLTERDALRAQIAAVQALADEWRRELDEGRIATPDAVYCWDLAERELRRALADTDSALRGVRAEAWDEGYLSGVADGENRTAVEPNPYREQEA